MRGYQFDIDGGNRYTGQNYEEKGRLFLALRGQVTRIVGTRKPIAVSSTGDNKELAGLITDGWNSCHMIARGNVLMHLLNGRLMCTVIDDDPVGRKSEGRTGWKTYPRKGVFRELKVHGSGFRITGM